MAIGTDERKEASTGSCMEDKGLGSRGREAPERTIVSLSGLDQFLGHTGEKL